MPRRRPEDVVEEETSARAVARAREGDARLLPAGEVEAALADLRQIALRQNLQVGVEAARGDHLCVIVAVKGLAKEDVAPKRRVLDPRILRAVRDAAAHDDAPGQTRHVADQ